LALDGDKWLTSCFGWSTVRERACIKHWTGDWMSPIAILDVGGVEKNPRCQTNSQSLYWLLWLTSIFWEETATNERTNQSINTYLKTHIMLFFTWLGVIFVEEHKLYCRYGYKTTHW